MYLNNMSQPLRITLRGLVIFLLCTVRLRSESIAIPNGSFESPSAVFVNTHIDSWQKTPKPADYDESGGYQWEQLAGVFTNTPATSFDHIENCDLGQAAYLFAVPQIGIFQDYDSTDWSHSSPLHALDVRFEVGSAYDLVVGIIGGGGGMLEGTGLDMGLYYRDTNGTRVVVGVLHVTNSAVSFPNHTRLVDYTLSLPVVKPDDAWAGQHLGILLVSVAIPANQGGYWDLDHVRLFKLRSPVLTITKSAGNGSLVLSWGSEMGYRFQVKSSQDLLTWSDFGSPQDGTGTVLILPIPTAYTEGIYFRVEANLAP